MSLLSRYILKEFLGNMTLGLLIFTFILVMDRLFELVDLLLRKGVGVWLTVEMLLLLIPSSLMLTLPLSILLATLLTYGRLSENSEIVAMNASGLSPWSFTRSILAASAVASLFLIPFNSFWAPRVHSQFRRIYVEVLHRNPLVRIEERTFIQVGDYHLFVEDKSRQDNRLRGVTIYRTSVEGAPIRIFAARGTASVDPVRGMRLDLEDGRIEQIDPERPGQWFHTAFDTYSLSIPFNTTAAPEDRSVEELTTPELEARIRDVRQKGVPPAILVTQKHLRWALALTPLLFAMLAIPLAIRLHRGGRSIGFAMSLIIALLYYVLLMGGAGLGQRGMWPAAPSVWIGNIVLAGLAGYFMWRFEREGR